MQEDLNYDLLATFKEELSDFKKGIKVTQSNDKADTLRYGLSKGGYEFNQFKMINAVKMMYNSQFETGHFDSDGQRKLYLNITRFLCDVFTKNTDIDVKDYKFTPVNLDTSKRYESFLFQRYFGIFIKDSKFSELINDLNNDFAKYGTCVTKKLNLDIVRVPLETLINTQSAKSLKDAFDTGGHVTQVHDLTHIELQKYPNWKKVPYYKGKKTIYERYAYTPKSSIDKYNGGAFYEEASDFRKCMSIILLGNVKKGENDEVLFIEEIDDMPYIDAHSCKEDGRWLGIGQVEIQYENQIARNLTANLRRKALLWGSKKIFQSTSTDGISKNLAKNVQDGDVLNVGANGQILTIDTTSRSLSEYSSDEQIWAENTQQKSFSFEVATGESMPSGTPFRLGAVLSNSAASYYERQKEIFGLFLREMFYESLIPIFKTKAIDYTHIISKSEEGYSDMYEAMVECYKSDYYAKLALSPAYFTEDYLNEEEVTQYLQTEIKKSPVLYLTSDKELYTKAKYYIDLDITGESTNAQVDMETLSTIYQTMMQRGDPRADTVLDKILMLSGKSMRGLIGKSNPQQQQNPQGGQPVSMQNQQPAHL
jgi:hypothetical protein